MMLTGQEINALSLQGEENNWDDNQFARKVIAANNAKVLADLKPDVHNLVSGKDCYSADKVSALIQERDSLAARVKELEVELTDVKDGIELASRGF